jgi:hypothetical protein
MTYERRVCLWTRKNQNSHAIKEIEDYSPIQRESGRGGSYLSPHHNKSGHDWIPYSDMPGFVHKEDFSTLVSFLLS